jgi:hypothetical protein
MQKAKAMNMFKRFLVVGACALALNLSVAKVSAQGRNFDPAARRQQMLDNLKDRLEVTDDAEWKVLSDALGKVFDAQQATRGGGGRGMFGRGRNGGGGGGGGQDQAGNNNNNNNGGGNRRGGFGQPSAEEAALLAAIEAKAPADEIKAKLVAVRTARTANEAKLTSAQEELKKLVTARQEATLVLAGILK